MNVRFIACTLLILSVPSVRGGEPKKGPPEVEVVKPVVREVVDHEDFPGRAEAVSKVDVRPRVTGYIDKITFKEGSAVKKGDMLYEIDARPYQAEFEKAKAVVSKQEAIFVLAKANLERSLALRKTNSIGQEELLRAEADVDVAKATLVAAKASLEHAQIVLSFTKIVAPIDGRIGRTSLDAGNLVEADKTSLATIVSTDPLYVSFDVDERTILRLRRLRLDGKLKEKLEELPVQIGLADETGFPHQGKIELVNVEVDVKTGTLRCRAVFANPKGMLSPGMFVRVRLVTSEPYKSLVIPEVAVGTESGRRQVFVVVKDKVEARAIKLGPRQDDGSVTVNEGLQEEDRVIVSGQARVRPGAVVKATLVEMPKTEKGPEKK